MSAAEKFWVVEGVINENRITAADAKNIFFIFFSKDKKLGKDHMKGNQNINLKKVLRIISHNIQDPEYLFEGYHQDLC